MNNSNLTTRETIYKQLYEQKSKLAEERYAQIKLLEQEKVICNIQEFFVTQFVKKNNTGDINYSSKFTNSL